MSNGIPPRFVVSQWIRPATISLRLKGSNRDQVLMELVDLIPEIAGTPDMKQKLFRALQERESLCSTGIGDGIALPHARNALVGLVDQPVIVFGRHTDGIPYGAIDGIPARLFFLLVSPTVSQHLQLLARLSRMLRTPRLRNELIQSERAEKVIQILQDAELSL